MSDEPGGVGKSRWRVLQDAGILSWVLAVAIFVDSELVERFARPVIEVAADVVVRMWPRLNVGSATMEQGSPNAAAVVMITDEDAEDMADAWPLPVGAYTRFLKRARCLGASAVFLDIGLPHELRGLPPPRQGATEEPPPGSCFDMSPAGESTRSRFCQDVLAFRSAAISFSSAPKQGECSSPGLNTANDAPKPENHPPIPGDMRVYLSEQYDRGLRDLGRGETFAPQYVSAYVGGDNRYVGKAPPDPNYRARLQTAAVKLAIPNCVDGPSDDGKKIACPVEFDIRDTFTTPWLQRMFSYPEPDERSCVYRDKPWSPGSLGKLADLFNWAVDFARAASQQAVLGPPANWEKCPPVLTVRWREVFDPSWADRVARAFDHRAVLISAAVSGVSDLARTELHKGLPGVYLHALATESLLPSSAGPALPAPWHTRLLIFLSLSFLALLLRYWLQRQRFYRGHWLFKTNNQLRPPEVDVEWHLRATASDAVADIEGHQQTVEVSEYLSARRSLQFDRQPKTVRLLRAIPVYLLPMGLLLWIYWLNEFKASLCLRDLLFFGICHTEDLWLLDPTQVFGRTIALFRQRLQFD